MKIKTVLCAAIIAALVIGITACKGNKDENKSSKKEPEKAQVIDNKDEIYDEAFVSDDVTGNGTGSYTKSAYMAENNLVHCWDLLRDAMDTFGDDINVLDLGPEVCDTIIRCDLLSEVMDKAIEFVVKDMPE